MENISFKRHEENPLDSLGIGRVLERKAKAFTELAHKTISDINDLAKDYPEVRFVNWDPTYCRDMSIHDPFYGFNIHLKVSVFPFPSVEKVYDCFFEYVMESGIARLRWCINPGQEEMDKFGNIEECKNAFKAWLSQYCYHKDDQRRYKIKWM